jgi:regulator of ribonuclease activity A
MGEPCFHTADLCDRFDDRLQVCDPLLRPYGGRGSFHGSVVTVACFEDNSLVREALGEDGHGRVLVVDGGGSLRCAMLGDQLAALAVQNGWAGVVLNACIRDSVEIGGMALGVMALATHPRKSVKRGHGHRDQRVRFAGVYFDPGSQLYCDADGIVLAAEPLPLEG